MSYVPKRLKNFPSENIEEKNGNTKAVMKGCSSLDLNQSLEEMDPQLNLNLVLNSTDTIKLNPPKASEPLHSRHVIHHEELEYACNYCPKKFSNKQALGGHQNAHKFEKVIQRRDWQGQEANFGYTGNDSGNGMTSFAFPNSFNQAPKMMNSPHYPQFMQHQLHAHDYPGSMFPMTHESGVVHPGMELSSFCTSPINPQFTPFHTSMGQGASTSKGKSSASAENDQAENYRQINNAESQHHEDDLDLSLKL